MLEHPEITNALRTGHPGEIPEAPSFSCERCGAEIADDQSAYHLCERCEGDALRRLVDFLHDFTESEREYLDACLEGTSIVDPDKIKPILAS